MDTSKTEPVQTMNEEYRKLQQIRKDVYVVPPQTVDTAPQNAKTYPHYFRELPAGVTHIDIYRLFDMWDVKAGPIDHSIKKLLCLGARGSKSYKQDLEEVRNQIDRALEMLEEDEWSARLKEQPSEF